jgi:hypothetical protein
MFKKLENILSNITGNLTNTERTQTIKEAEEQYYDIYTNTIEDRLSDNTRKERKGVMIASLVGYLMYITGIVPDKLEIFGILFDQFQQRYLIFALLVITLYFLFTFVFYAHLDILIYRREINKLNLLMPKIFNLRKERDGSEMSNEQILELMKSRLYGKNRLGKIRRKIRFTIEFIIPILMALMSIILLVEILFN